MRVSRGRAGCIAGLFSALTAFAFPGPSDAAQERRSDLAELLSPEANVSLAFGAPLASLKDGLVVLVQFTSTRCPSLCVNQTFDLSAVAANLPADVRSRLRIVAVTVDPKHDDAPALAAFASGLGVDPKVWSFVRSDAIDRNVVVGLLGLPATAKDDPEQPDALLLFDAHGDLAQRYTGKPVARDHLAREIVALDRYGRRATATETSSNATILPEK